MIRSSIEKLMLGGSMVALLAAAAPAAAQDPGETAAARSASDQGEDGHIVVTGSRIQRDPNETSAAPIVSVRAEDLIASGEINVAETLRELPALINSLTINDSVDRTAFSSYGLSQLNLRNLGANRTLVLVNGRRHVAAVPGTQIVDIQSIPSTLVERVDVLTGGASSIYGADAVTGVVNFVLKRDHEGLDLRSQIGISEKGDGRTFIVEGVWGKNFADGRGNITIAGSYNDQEEILLRDREFAKNRAYGFVGNPALRFQPGEINSSTPNFQRFFTQSNGRYPFGYAIPTADAFATSYRQAFGSTPTLTAAEQALIARINGAPGQAIVGSLGTLAFNPRGSVSRADNREFKADVNGNGISDCAESFTGWVNFTCYIVAEGGGVRIPRDPQGIVPRSGQSQANRTFGSGIGDTGEVDPSSRAAIPASKRYTANLLARYEFSPAAEVFGEFKYVRSEGQIFDDYTGFYDGLLILPDNPFIPTALQADAREAGGLRISKDQLADIGPGIRQRKIDTYRGVVGLRGELTPNLNYELSAVYGRTDHEEFRPQVVFIDRYYAAVDVVKGPNGQPICRSDITSATTPPGDRAEGRPGFVTFNPGDGTCRPLNLFSGASQVSQDVANFITGATTNRYRQEQLVVTGQLTGDTGNIFELPGGPVRFALGAEYRQEKSRVDFDPLARNILPVTTPAGAAGTQYTGRFFFTGNTGPSQRGKYDVREAFAEIELPILSERPFFHELRIGAAGRYSDYSTAGETFTWNVNGVWAPVPDIRFRGAYAHAVRAPNIAELFLPETTTRFNANQVVDPCTKGAIDLLRAANDPRTQNRIRNCAAIGIPADYVDPSILPFFGVSSGNRNAEPETAKTWTVGGILQPRFLPGFFASVDYYNIKIESAIASPGAQSIVNACYDGPDLNERFCSLFTRASNFDINFLRQAVVNFARYETAGIDATVGYQFALGENRFSLRGTVNWVDKINEYLNVANLNLANSLLREQGTPEWSGVGSVTYERGPVSLTYRLQYVGEQAESGVNIETADAVYGPGNYMADEVFIHDISASIEASDRFTFYGGVSNLTDVKPYRTLYAYPVSPVGRFFFVGARTKF